MNAVVKSRAFYLAEKGEIYGVFKQGSRWVGLKTIREGYQKRASGLEVA
jgi:hypothetical protein